MSLSEKRINFKDFDDVILRTLVTRNGGTFSFYDADIEVYSGPLPAKKSRTKAVQMSKVDFVNTYNLHYVAPTKPKTPSKDAVVSRRRQRLVIQEKNDLANVHNLSNVQVENRLTVQELEEMSGKPFENGDLVQFGDNYQRGNNYTLRIVHANVKETKVIQVERHDHARLVIPLKVTKSMENAIAKYVKYIDYIEEIELGKTDLFLQRVFFESPNSELLNKGKFSYFIRENMLCVKFNGMKICYIVGYGKMITTGTQPGFSVQKMEYDFGINKSASFVNIVRYNFTFNKPNALYSEKTANAMFNVENAFEDGAQSFFAAVFPSKKWEWRQPQNWVHAYEVYGPESEKDAFLANVKKVKVSFSL